MILAQAVASEDAAGASSSGLGSRIAAMFADAALEATIPEWRGDVRRAGEPRVVILLDTNVVSAQRP